MKTKKCVKRIAALVTVLALCVAFFSVFIYVFAGNKVDKRLDERLFSAAKSSKSTEYVAYTEDGKEISVYSSRGEGRKLWRDYEEIGETVEKAFLSAEDREFYRHRGVNIKRTLYAAASFIFGKIKGEDRGFGASTVTQQVIKNISGDNGYSLSRKLKEIIRARGLERRHTKKEILEMYLNIVPMSDNIYGVGAASEIFFGKEPCQLSISEAATLAGITNSPARFNPYNHPEECLAKRNRVLYAMLDFGAISREEYEGAREKPLGVLPKGNCGSVSVANWFVETAREDIIQELMRKYSLSRGAAALLLSSGTRVYLTENIEIQRILEECFANVGVGESREYAMVVTDSQTGALLGVVGGKGAKRGERLTNYALTNRAPGSILKPIALYAPLINEKRVNWATVVEDSPLYYRGEGENERGYPRNSPDRYDGRISLKDALRQSKNTVALRLYEMLGKEKIYDILSNGYGIDTLVVKKEGKEGYLTDLDAAPLALGQLTDGVSLRKMTEYYSVFTDGELKAGRSYFAVLDSEGKPLLESKSENKRILSKESAGIMTKMLSEVVNDGTARSITLKNTVDTAGKTGTSGGDRDKWFIGFTPYFTAGIWTGAVRAGDTVTGASHLEIWDRVMTRIHSELIKGENLIGFSDEGLLYRPYPSFKTVESAEGGAEKVIGYEWGYFTSDNLPENSLDEYGTGEI